MGAAYEVTTVRVRRQHECDGCGYIIEPGTPAQSWSWVGDGYGWGRSYWHVPCYSRADDTGALYDDGMLPLLCDDREWMGLLGALRSIGDVLAIQAGKRDEPVTDAGLIALLRREIPVRTWEPLGCVGALTRLDDDRWIAVGRPSGVWSVLRHADVRGVGWESCEDVGAALQRAAAMLGGE